MQEKVRRGSMNCLGFSISQVNMKLACMQTLLLWRSFRAKRIALKLVHNSKVCTQANIKSDEEDLLILIFFSYFIQKVRI